MAIKELVFNGLKWFNVTTSGISLTFNGTDYIKKECFRVVSTNNHYNGAWLFDMQSDGSLKIERDGGDYNVLPANTPFISYDFRYASSDPYVYGGFYKISVCPEHPNDVGKWVIADDTSIWGGKVLLAHLWRCFKPLLSLSRMEVA